MVKVSSWGSQPRANNTGKKRMKSDQRTGRWSTHQEGNQEEVRRWK